LLIAGIGPVPADAADQSSDMDRQKPALAIMAIPEGELLAAVDGIDRLVDIVRVAG
jgi:hypothetical protein